MSSRVHPSGTGLKIAGPGAQILSFGQERAVVEQAVVSRMGEPVSRLANQECGAGPMQFTSFAGGLTLNFQNGAFAGWALERSEEDKGFTTARGIGVGSQEAELKAAYAVERIEGSTLGDEFTSAGGINGFLSDRGSGKQVESLYAGTNCFFR